MKALQHYKQLVERVDTFGKAIRRRYPEQITCHVGCDGCCYQQFTVFPVEAYALGQAVADLSRTERQRLRERLQQEPDPWHIIDEPAPCVLLQDGRCLLYQGRPVLCRMHGFPLFSTMIERPDGGQRDCCPLNFPGMPLETIEAQTIYNLDLVNQTLAAIHHLFVQEQGGSAQRVTIRQAVLGALAERDAEGERNVAQGGGGHRSAEA
jgi:uncharacterized protein